MNYNFLRSASPLTQIFYATILILVTGSLFMLLGMLLAALFLGVGLSESAELLTDLSNPLTGTYMRLLQVAQSLGVFLVPPIILAYIISDNPKAFLQLDKRPSEKIVVFVVAMIAFAMPFIEWLGLVNSGLSLPSFLKPVEEWMRQAENQATATTKLFLEGSTTIDLIRNLFIVAVLPALGEELLFRGLIQQLLKKAFKNADKAIWLTAILFSALHLQFFGFFPRVILGVLFGYLLEWTGSLWIPILAHFLNNAFGVITYFVTGTGLESEPVDASQVFNGELFMKAFIGVMFMVLLLRRIYQMSVQPVEVVQKVDETPQTGV